MYQFFVHVNTIIMYRHWQLFWWLIFHHFLHLPQLPFQFGFFDCPSFLILVFHNLLPFLFYILALHYFSVVLSNSLSLLSSFSLFFLTSLLVSIYFNFSLLLSFCSFLFFLILFFCLFLFVTLLLLFT